MLPYGKQCCASHKRWGLMPNGVALRAKVCYNKPKAVEIMQKEILTIQNIKKDIHQEIKDSYIRLVIFSSFFLVWLALFLTTPSSSLFYFRYKLVFGFGVLVFLLILITQIKDLAMLYKNLKNKNSIVKDKLISAEIKEDFCGKVYVKIYRLNFSGYGEYVIHAENYKWSSTYSMSAEGVYYCSNSGDEFYLVLSKPHTGRILFAYNTKMFEME